MIDELPVQATIKEVEVPVQQIIVNNEVKTITAKVNSLCCSSCGRVIYTFNQNESYIDVYETLVNAKEELSEQFGYCPKCGKALRYDFDIIDGEVIDEQVSV